MHTVEPYEEQIRERVTQLVRHGSDKTAVRTCTCSSRSRDESQNADVTLQLSFQHIDLLEQKVGSLTTQLEKQYNVHRSGDQRLKQAEDGIFEMQDRLKRAESELASADMLRDSLRADKERVSAKEHHTCSRACPVLQ